MMYCRCLCAVNHPDRRGVCQGEATRTLVFSEFKQGSPLEGTEVEVRMCDSCATHTLAAKAERAA